MNRTPVVAGNWKMNTTLEKARELVTEIKGMVKDEVIGDIEIMVFPPFPFLSTVSSLLIDSGIKTGAQNISQFGEGAYTGEVSAAMLSSMNINVTLIGHSERRQYFGDSHEVLALKVNRAFENGLQIIFCCGETLTERESGHHFDVVKTQLTDSLFQLSKEQFSKVIVAYEPVWAIGTGVTASSEQAQEMHAFIRKCIDDIYGNEISNAVRILYGGSVKASNASELFNCPDIDGGLIGGAALESRSFTDIIKSGI